MRDGQGHSLQEFLHRRGEGGLLVVEPVDQEWLVFQGHGCSERDISHWVNGSCDEEAEVALLGVGEGVAPDSADVVGAVSEENIRDAASEEGQKNRT